MKKESTLTADNGNTPTATTTTLVYDIGRLAQQGVNVYFDEVALSFEIETDESIDERDFLMFLERYKYDALEADALLTAVTGVHNKVMLSRILYRCTE